MHERNSLDDVDVVGFVRSGLSLAAVAFGPQVAVAVAVAGVILLVAACESTSYLAVVNSMPWGQWYFAAPGTRATAQVVPADRAPSERSERPGAAVAVPQPTMGTLALDRAQALVVAALGWSGVRYAWGGCDRQGVDCSCLVQLAARAVGVSIPRTTAGQFATLPAVTKPGVGDLIFFNDTCARCGPNPTHVGVLMGGGQMVHAGDTVRVESVDTLYWHSHLAGYRRLP